MTLKACGHFVNEDLKERMAEDVHSYQATWMSLCGDVRGPSTTFRATFFKQSRCNILCYKMKSARQFEDLLVKI